MDDKEYFVKQVQRQLSPELKSLFSDVPRVVAMLAEIGFVNYNYPQQDVKKVIQFLPRWVVHQKSKKQGDVVEGSLDTHALLTADYLADSLMPKIKAIRKAYFGSEESPFKNVKEMERWNREAVAELAEQLKSKGLSQLSGEARTYSELMEKITELSKIGISPTSFLYYIMADIKPLQMPYQIMTPGKGLTKGRRKCWYVVITLNTELSFKDLLAIYNVIKESLGVKKGKRLNEKHLQLYTMVRERGGIPTGKGTVGFWQSVLEEWNGRHEVEYREWRCIKRAYDRLCKKLNAQYPAEEVGHSNNRTKRLRNAF